MPAQPPVLTPEQQALWEQWLAQLMAVPLPLEMLVQPTIPATAWAALADLPKVQPLQRHYAKRQQDLAKKLFMEKALPILKKGKALTDKQWQALSDQWRQDLAQAVTRVLQPLYRAWRRERALQAFLGEKQDRLNCTLLPKPDIQALLPHVNLAGYHRQGRLRGALFEDGIKLWFYAKEDAEKLAQTEAHKIAKQTAKAQAKALAEQTQGNRRCIEGLVWAWLWQAGYPFPLPQAQDPFLQALCEQTLALAEVQEAIAANRFSQPGFSLPKAAQAQLQATFEQAYTSDVDFAQSIDAEWARRKRWQETL